MVNSIKEKIRIIADIIGIILDVLDKLGTMILKAMVCLILLLALMWK